MEEIKRLLDEDETILWQGESDPEVLKENYLFWKDIAIISIFPFIILNVLIFIYIPPFIFLTFLMNEVIELILVYSLTIYLLFIMVLVYVSRFRSLYINRKVGNISYFITSKRIFIGTRDMKDASKFYTYSTDTCCHLPIFDFKSQGMFAYIEQKRVNKIEIQTGGDCYHVYLSYEIEENDNWRFKMAGLQDVSSLSKVLVEKLSFEKLESLRDDVDLFLRD